MTGKLIQMKTCQPPELMRFIITLLLLPLPLMTAITQMRIKRLRAHSETAGLWISLASVFTSSHQLKLNTSKYLVHETVSEWKNEKPLQSAFRKYYVSTV